MAENYLEISEVQVDGEVYQIVDRVAEVGDKVLFYYENSMDRIVTTVTDVGYTAVDIKPYLDAEGDLVAGLEHGAYRVLEPVETPGSSEPSPIEADSMSESLTEMLANLAQEVVKLRKQVDAIAERTDSNAKDIRTFGEEFTGYLHTPSPFAMEEDVIEINGRLGKLEELTEMITDDIVLLDERTQPEELAESVLGNITIRRSMYGGY